jgi:hypothetical protein
VEQVEFYANRRLLAVVTNAPFGFLWEDVTPGSHPLTASCIDGQGVTNTSLPVVVLVYTNNLMPAPKLAAGTTSSYMIDALGNLYVWGLNRMGFYGLSGTLDVNAFCVDYFECGDGDLVKMWYPEIAKFPEGVTGWLSVSSSDHLEVDGSVYQHLSGWALGNDYRLYQYGALPFQPANGATSWTMLEDAFMVDAVGRLYYDGRLRNPQCPVPISEVIDGMVMTSNRVAYALNGTQWDRVPFPPGVTGWRELSCSVHCLGIGNDGQLYSWGYNYSGQLGLGDNANRTEPTRVPPPPGVTNWAAAEAGGHQSFAIGDDGQLYAWGRNWEYQLGIGPPGSHLRRG